jgi:hypothetical protein
MELKAKDQRQLKRYLSMRLDNAIGELFDLWGLEMCGREETMGRFTRYNPS